MYELKDRGEMAEWSKAGALKASEGKLSGGSNPSLSDTAPEKELFLLPKGLAMDQNLLGLSPAELVDRGICPTCFDREHNGALYGDNKDILIYKDEDIECFFVRNPRAVGHMCISSIEHYHDMSEAPDHLNEKIIRFSKQLMIIIKEIFKCERVYLCSMCDGPNNHYHVQLIPRYSYEKRGSKNFVKERKSYIYDEYSFVKIKTLLSEYAASFTYSLK